MVRKHQEVDVDHSPFLVLEVRAAHVEIALLDDAAVELIGPEAQELSITGS